MRGAGRACYRALYMGAGGVVYLGIRVSSNPHPNPNPNPNFNPNPNITLT